MGGSAYKKFKKQEKAKVKLKGNKTLLPKGQNVTDTSFKVKKIVVREQLKEHKVGELLTRKHLGIKELIGRLSHHNAGMRQDALSGLRELMSVHGSNLIQDNLSALLRATMTLTIDKEADVRSDTIKLLAIILDKVNEVELTPLFPIVVCHLACAMTQIEPAVRTDSLRVLDTVLSAAPRLTAANSSKLLPHFLDLISSRGSAGGEPRTLSLNLDGQVTSDKWRAKVIGRLNRLFSIILRHCVKDRTSDAERTVRVRHDQPTYVGLYSSVLSRRTATEGIAKLPVQEYAETLMPLLLDTFIEAVPKCDQQDLESAGCVVSSEAAALLQSIVEIMLHLWNLIKHTPDADSLTKWFVATWGDTVTLRLVKGRFPYSFTAANSRKRQRETDQIMAALQISRDLEASCSLLNLQLCLLVFLLSPPGDLWAKAIQFIKCSVRGSKPLHTEESETLCQCLEACSGHNLPADTQSLLSVLARDGALAGADGVINKRVFDFLVNVALTPSHRLHQDKHFTTWLDSLPASLCKASVSFSTIKQIAAIATCNLPAFSNSLDGWIEEILENLPNLKITGDKEDDGRWLIVGLLYWVNDWDKEAADIVKQLIVKQSLGSELTDYLVNILQFKISATENNFLNEILTECNR